MHSSELSILNLLFYNPRSSFRFSFRQRFRCMYTLCVKACIPSPGPIRTKSPVKPSTSRPYWAPAADAVLKIDNEWGGGRSTAFKDILPHKNSPRSPVGGNHLYMCSSVSWANFDKIIFLLSWSTGGARDAYFFQDEILEELIPTLSLIWAKY